MRGQTHIHTCNQSNERGRLVEYNELRIIEIRREMSTLHHFEDREVAIISKKKMW